MTGFSDAQLDDLKAPLERAAVKTRPQAGRQLSYLEGWHVIAEANRIFGFDAWDRETLSCICVSERPAKLGPNRDRDGWRVAYVGKVRVTVRAGDQVVVREGTGYGSGIDADVGEAHESAAKECETDAMKRALMTFGSPLGLALYDKTQSDVAPAPAPAPRSEQRRAHPRKADAAEAYARLKTAMNAATTPKMIDELIRANSDVFMPIIKEALPEHYDALMTLASTRKTEMYSSA